MNAAACMTRELAESGSEFVITMVNGCDLVPCFSSGSLDDLRTEVGIYHSTLITLKLYNKLHITLTE